MSRNGSGVYSLPPGSIIANGETSDATDLNVPLQDIEADLNVARPIAAGGTGATSAQAARANLGIASYDNVAAVIAASDAFSTDTIIVTSEEGFSYKAVASSGDVVNAGGQNFEVLPDITGAIPFAAFGPDKTGTTSVTSLMESAIEAATRYARSVSGTSFVMQGFVTVSLEAGAEYLLETQLDVPLGNLNVNFKCIGGRATFKGSGTKANKGMVFEAVRNITFENINFTNFTTATEWDTNNVDSNLIRYIDCEWTDCDLGIDTVGYAVSRSTVLVLDRCRAGGVLQLAKSYCDMTIINDGHYRNADDDGAFIFADSQLVINGGVWTPYVTPAATCRWIDLDNTSSGAQGSRSATLNHVRFGPEQGGGIPVIYSSVDGNSAGGTRTTLTHIAFNETYAGSNNATTPQGLVVLMDNAGATATLAPNTISFRGGSLNASNGLVVTENGTALTLGVGQFAIEISDATQARWGDETTQPSTPLVEDMLEKYVTSWRIDGKLVTTTGTATVSVGQRKKLRFDPASALTLTDLLDSLDGHIVTLLFSNANTTIQDASNGGAFNLADNVNHTPNENDTITLVYDRATARWWEISRSPN